MYPLKDDNDEVYVNFYQVPGTNGPITSTSLVGLQNAITIGNHAGSGHVSKKKCIARIKLSTMCIAGRFDF